MVAAFVSRMDSITTFPFESITATEIVAEICKPIATIFEGREAAPLDHAVSVVVD